MVEPNLAYCQNCGAPLNMHTSYSSRQPYQAIDATNSHYSGKKPWVAAVLALSLGFFGIWGIGHFYSGRFVRGIGFFIVGLLIGGLFWLSVVLTIIIIGYIGMILFGLFFIGGWLWQGFDAYNAAQDYNELHVPPPTSGW